MKRRVYKFPLRPEVGPQSVVMAPHGVVLSAGCDLSGQPCLWALVDPDQDAEPREFVLAWTGQDLPEESIEWNFWGSFSYAGLIWHVFETGSYLERFGVTLPWRDADV